MSNLFDPERDPRTVDELFFAALTEADEDVAWQPVAALHFRGSREVLDRARSLCLSGCAFERRIGADILGQLGVPDRTFPDDCREILLKMLAFESNHDVLHSALIALSHNDFSDVVPYIVPWTRHADSRVRYGAAFALAGHEDEAAVNCLIRLSSDVDSDVRDWATFGLGTQCDIDTPQIRDALAARLDDSDDDTRAEAIMGLARRGDQRVASAIQRELASDSVGSLIFDAAELLGIPLPAEWSATE